jgi:hypothetical protein
MTPPAYRKELPENTISRPADYEAKLGKIYAPVLYEEKADGEHVALCNGEIYGRKKSQRDVYENFWHKLPWGFASQLTERLLRMGRKYADGNPAIVRVPLWVEGELIVEGGTSSDVKTAIIEHDPRLQFRAFRVPELDGYATHRAQRTLLHDALFDMPQQYQMNDGILEEVPNFIPLISTELADPQYLRDCAERLGIEGFVIWEDRTSLYGPRLWKVKVEKTFDLVVMGINPGKKGQFSGMCGSLEGGWYTDGTLVAVASAGGMKLAVREEITDADIGRAFEVKCNEFASKGRMKHARFQHWRDDKPNAECEAPATWTKKFSKQFVEESKA